MMVKRSKGKSIRGAMWFGQEQVFSETRGKPAECDLTRGIKSIIPTKIFAEVLFRLDSVWYSFSIKLKNKEKTETGTGL